MPQAVPAIAAAIGAAVTTTAAAQFIATILLNIAVGAIEFEDATGRWIAVPADPGDRPR